MNFPFPGLKKIQFQDMCGRAACSLAPEAILQLVGLQESEWVDKVLPLCALT
jgi:hypothetical protein